MDNAIKYFVNELATIVDRGIREQTTKVLNAVPDAFFEAPASTTGKYHPEYALGEGGLMRHTKAALMFANSLFEINSVADKFRPDERDYIRAALILHDCCKCGKDWSSKYTKFEHPVLAAEFVKDILGECQFTDMMYHLIPSHMGEWNINVRSSIVLPLPTELDQIVVHVCDYMASRKYISVDFNMQS